MGQAKLRGSFEQRRAFAIAAGRTGNKSNFYDGGGYFMGGHRNSGFYGRKPHRLNRPWKRRAAGL